MSALAGISRFETVRFMAAFCALKASIDLAILRFVNYLSCSGVTAPINCRSLRLLTETVTFGDLAETFLMDSMVSRVRGDIPSPSAWS